MKTPASAQLSVAYFSMEIAIRDGIPTYAGGLGILAADLMQSCADKNLAVACVTMCWKHGYNRQSVAADGSQAFVERSWDPAKEGLEKLDATVDIVIEGKTVKVGVWRLFLPSPERPLPVYFLDTDVPGNTQEDKDITKHLYGGNMDMRLKQELVLGIGGLRMLRALGHASVGRFHLNEGHSAFLTLELLRENDFKDDVVKEMCAFTTHTPIPAGHDVFSYDAAARIAGDLLPWHIRKLAGEDMLSTTSLAMSLSRYTCGVSKIHGQVARDMLKNGAVDFITNGVHHLTWASAPLQKLFDAHLPGWREDPMLLAGARAIPATDLWKAHQINKKSLCKEIERQTGKTLSPDILTIVAARRIVPYKQTELLYEDMDRLLQIAGGKLQVIHSGNSNPNDSFSQDIVRHLIARSEQYKDRISITYLPNHNPDTAKILTAGADIWLNTPERLKEASGTSGMKAALNGGINLSILDGWWAEAYAADPECGWRIGPEKIVDSLADMKNNDAEDVYTQLEYEIIPEYYAADKETWADHMRRSIAQLGYFNTHRCIDEYVSKAWK